MGRPVYSLRVGGYWDNENVIITRKVGRVETETRVRTWADGHGTWHAEFSTTDNARVNAHIARMAIGYELACREGASAANYLRVRGERANGLPGVVRYAEAS